jgi:hypothetical protein
VLVGKEKTWSGAPYKLKAVSNLAGSLYDQGRFKAESLYVRVLKGSEKHFGPENFNMLEAINGVGVSLCRESVKNQSNPSVGHW